MIFLKTGSKILFCLHAFCILTLSSCNDDYEKSYDQEDVECKYSSQSVDPENIKNMFNQISKYDTNLGLSDFSKNFLLLKSASYGDLNQVRELIKRGADVNFINQYGDGFPPPLAWASRCGRREVVTYLLKHGADPNLEFSYFYPANVLHTKSTPTIWAISSNQVDIVPELRAYGGDTTRREVIILR